MATRLDRDDRPAPADLHVVVTPMRRRHLRGVLRIEHQVYSRPWSMGLFLGELAAPAGRSYVVARIGSSVVGYAGAMAVLDDGHITTVAVDPEWNRFGIGTRLLACTVRRVVALGVQQLTLEVRMSNTEAQRLYQRFGFAPAGVRRGYYVDTNEDAMVMWAHDVASPAYAERVAAMEAQVPGTTELVGFED